MERRSGVVATNQSTHNHYKHQICTAFCLDGVWKEHSALIALTSAELPAETSAKSALGLKNPHQEVVLSGMSTPTGKKGQKQAKSCEKEAARAECTSSQSSSFQILLQSRGSSNQSYPDKISMTSKDMKALNVKAGQIWVQFIFSIHLTGTDRENKELAITEEHQCITLIYYLYVCTDQFCSALTLGHRLHG